MPTTRNYWTADSPNMIAAFAWTEDAIQKVAFEEACRTQQPVKVTAPDGETWTVYAE